MRGIVIALVALLSSLLPIPGSARDFTPKECPVVGNKNSKIYHTPGGLNYRRMLQENKRGADNRVCFPNEEAARTAGYRKSKT
ncbi:MAG: hypothetical protein FJ246_09800 [Nitrospira sp.]|nr:hypothetical protein [Nitrospira sp.]